MRGKDSRVEQGRGDLDEDHSRTSEGPGWEHLEST